jgi:membrane-bound metal-dependent hydrolase YbcI (DUF457 family)
MLLRWNQELRFHKLAWLVETETVNRVALAAGALYGTFSHLILDSLMHDDIHPLAPFSQANPLLHIVSHDDVYVICTVFGFIGLGVWPALKWRNRMGDQ